MNSSFLFFFSFSFFPIRGYNNPRFLTPAYSCLLLFLASALQLFLFLFLSFSRSLSLLLFSLPSLLFFLAHSCSLFPSRTPYTLLFFLSAHISFSLLSLSLSLLSIVLSSLPLSRVLFALSSSHAVFSRMPSSVSRKTSFPSSFIFLSFPFPSLLFLSLFCISHTSHSSLRVSSSVSLVFLISSLSRSPFFLAVAVLPLPPFCSFSSLSLVSLAFYRRTLPSSRSIELRSSGSFYLAQSSYFLRLFFFFYALSFLSSPLSSSAPLVRSYGIL